MPGPLHSQQQIADGIHSAISFTYPTTGSMLAATGFLLTDLYKVALITSGNLLYLLTNTVTPTWVPFGDAFTTITGSGGTSVVDGGGFNFIVSSSAPPWNAIFGQGGTTVSVNGRWVTVSSSLGQSSSYYGQGGTSVTVAGSSITISSSLGQSSSYYGQGGTKVTVASNSQVTVSSSVGAPPEADYVLWSNVSMGELPNSKLLSGGVGITLSGSATALFAGINAQGLGGITLLTGSSNQLQVSSSRVTVTGSGGTSVSTGGGTTYTVSSSLVTVAGLGGTSVSTGGGTTYTVSSSIYADPSASFILVSPDGVLPNSRKLTAGVGITLTDGGAGGSLTINNAAIPTGGVFVSSSFMSTSVAVPAILSGTMFIMMKTSNQNMTATLPNPATYPNSLIVFKDIEGFASGGSLSTVLVSPASALTTIDTLTASYTFASPWGSKGFVSPDGISWFTVY